jgi:hypothetical protein
MCIQFPRHNRHRVPCSCTSHRRVSSIFNSDLTSSVGVGAYLGAASLISNKDYLTAAGSILTVEARHNTYILGANKGNPIPGAFDTPLGINEVWTIASQFIKSCPASNPALPVKAFPTLAVAGSAAVTAGETIHVSGNWNDGTFAVVIAGLNTYPVPIVNNQFKFPETSVTGQVL